MSATCHEQCSHNTDVGQVKHGHHMEVTALGIHSVDVQQRHGCDDKVVMTEHYPFREACSAACVEDTEK
ncbi:hypothetical protein D9M69_450490 [compost metagenome]